MLQQPKIISANKPFTADKEYVYIMAQNGHQEQNERGGGGREKRAHNNSRNSKHFICASMAHWPFMYDKQLRERRLCLCLQLRLDQTKLKQFFWHLSFMWIFLFNLFLHRHRIGADLYHLVFSVFSGLKQWN